jgi:sugar lactone lactonase YvrE
LGAVARQPVILGVAVVIIAAAGVTATSLGGRPGPASATVGPSTGPTFGAIATTTTRPPESGPSAGPSASTAPTPTPYVADVAIEPLFDAPGDWVGGIAWDGTDVWVAGGAELFRVAEDGRVLGIFEPPDYSPEGLTWDGDRFWLFTTNAGAVYRFSVDRSRPTARPTVAKVIDSPIRTIGGGANHGLAWDGSGLWLSDFYNVYRLDTTGKVLTTLAFGDEVNGLAWDGRRLWIAVNHLPSGDATLVALDPEGRATATYEIPVVEVFSMTWAGDAFLVAAAFELAGEPRLWRVEILGETTP